MCLFVDNLKFDMAKVDPPKVFDNASGYPEYKLKLQRWSRITKTEKKQQAEMVLYHLEGHPSGIQQKIDTALGQEVIENEDGLKKIIAYLDEIYAEDEMTEAWSKYKQFIRLKKEVGQPVSEFIAEFDKAHKRAKESGCEFSDIVLGFNLLESCHLSETDEKFILTAVDFATGKTQKNLLEQIKNSLRKFQSRERLSSDKDSSCGMKVKEESTLVADVKEALLSEGWQPPSHTKKKKPKKKYTASKNSVGPDGKIRKCFRCQSVEHFVDRCPRKEDFPRKDTSTKKDTVEQTLLAKVLAEKTGELSMICCAYDENTNSQKLQPEKERSMELVLISQREDELCLLVTEAGNRGVIDTGCSNTVAGVKWINKYISSVSPSFAQNLTVIPSTKTYEFGGGEKRESRGKVKLPAVIGERKVNVTMDIVDAEIPLLIGSNSLEAAGAILDFNTNTATFFGEEVGMVKVGAGHFCIDLISEHIETHIDNVDERNDCIQSVLVTSDKLSEKDLRKLHHYYGHTPAERLLSFLKKAGKDTDELKDVLNRIETSCEACIRTKNSKPRPKSSIPRVEGPNDIVTIDLKQWKEQGKNQYICYMIDMHSRLTLGQFIPDKKPDSIVQCIMGTWVPVFGVMQGIHSDIGGEVSNDILEDVAHKLGVKLTTTASYSPHQNGLNERNHAVVDMMITRMMCSDQNLKPEMALLWALNAKNSLENCYGFSPFQLHIGKNPVLSSVTRDGPPSFETITKSKSFAEHLNAMHCAREEFVKLESDVSLKKALKSRAYSKGEDIIEGDWIYYKKNDTVAKGPVWKGPSKVVAVNGKKLFVDQGARLGTVNRDDAVRKGEELWTKDAMSDDQEKAIEESISNALRQVSQKRAKAPPQSSSESDSEEDEEESDEESSEEEGTETHSQDDELSDLSEQEDEVVDEHGGGEGQTTDLRGDAEYNPPDSRGREDVLSESQVEEHPVPVRTNEVDTDEEEKSNEANIDSAEVKKGDIIKYLIPETDVVETAKVLSRAAKATGPNRFWWLVQVRDTGEKKSVNTAAVKNLKRVSDEDVHDTAHALVVSVPRHLHNAPECMAAKESELKNWDDFGVYKEVEDEGQKTLNTNWVLVRKEKGVKARLCIRGDQEQDKENIRTDSPTINKINIKLFYVLSVYFGWDVRSADIKSAFLQGAKLDRDVYVRPPLERRIAGIIWKMLKRAYGFVDASRGFYLELDKTLVELGCKASIYDPALYMYFGADEILAGLLLAHVDDLLHGTGTDEFYENVLNPLKEKFMFGSEEDDDFKYVGMHVVQVGSTISTDQDHYVESLEIPDLSRYGDDLEAVLDEEGQADYRSAVGRIGWVANASRPDLAYDNLVLSMKLGTASLRDMKLIVKIMKKMKCENTSMKFVDLGPIAEWSIEGYGDAGFRSLPDKTSSCGGHVVMITNKNRGVSSVLNWKSNKIRRVVGSSTAAEALAANDTLDEMIYVQFVLKELLGSVVDGIPLHLITDSKNLWKSVQNSTLAENPRLRTDIAKIKESLKKEELKDFLRVNGSDMIADVLTKKGASGVMLMNLLRSGRAVKNT